jgi:hypothetical protein
MMGISPDAGVKKLGALPRNVIPWNTSGWWFQWFQPRKMMEWKSVGIMKFSTEWEKTCSKPPTRLGFSWNTINFRAWSWDKYEHFFGTAAGFLPFTVTSHNYISIIPPYTSLG